MFKKRNDEIKYGNWFCLKPGVIPDEEPNSVYGLIVSVDSVDLTKDNISITHSPLHYLAGSPPPKEILIARKTLLDLNQSERITKDWLLDKLSQSLNDDLSGFSKTSMNFFRVHLFPQTKSEK